jgi:hypothetical protein
MTMITANPCVRCGKDRIISRTWVDNVGNYPITRTDTVCPDPECQKAVEEEIAAKQKKKDEMMDKKLREKEQRAKGIDPSQISPKI